MTDKPIKLLLIDNNHEDVLKIRETLDTSQTDQFECIHIDRLSEGLESLVNHVFDIIMLDLSLSGGNAFDTFIDIHQASPDIPVITMSRIKDDDLATRALQEGADDHLFKGDIDSDSLKRSILNAMKRKQTKDQLLRIQDAWKQTFDAVPDLIMILDAKHRIIRANKAMAEKLGLAPEELIGRSCYHAVHGTENPPHFCPHARLLSDGLDHSVEVHEDHLGGDFLVSVSPLYSPDGTLIGSVHVARDITEIKRTEIELHESEQELGIRNRILEIFLTIPDDEAYAEILKLILKTFESDYGTFGYFNESGAFVVPSMTRKIYWEKCQVPDKNIIFERGTFSGIWERALKDRKTFYSNEGPFHTPEGHVPIKNTMVTPIIYRDEIISAIHIANKSTTYDEKDVLLLENIANYLAPVLHARLERDRQERERKITEEALLLELSVNSALSKIYKPLILPFSSLKEITNTILDQAMKLTHSMHGYVSSLDPISGDSIVHTLTDMLSDQCMVSEKNNKIVFPRGSDGRYHGLWGHSLNTRGAFYTNMPESHPASSGIPDGHIPIKRFLSVPVFSGDKLVGQIALANAGRDYTDRDLETISRLGNYYALAIHRKRVEEELLDKTHDLRERIKELNCLYNISQLLEEEGDTLGETLQKIINVIPPSWQYPEITSARMIFEDREFTTEHFEETIWKQTGDIVVHGKRAGSLEVCYSQEKPDRDEGPFLKEERHLLNAICERIGRFIEHKRSDEALRKAHDKLEQLVKDRTAALDSEHALRKTIEDSIISGIVAVDLEGRHTYVNRAFCKMVGWSEDELIGTKPPFVYWPSGEMENIKEAFQATLEGKIPPGGFELSLQRRDGERFYALILVSPLRDNQGNIAGWVSSVGDITSRKKAEKSLRKSEMSLSEAQRIAHLGNWEWNIETNELLWSDEIYRIFGLTPQEFGATYEAFLDSVHPDDREFVKRTVNEALYGMPYNIEHRIILPDGAIRTVHEQGEVTYGESGEPVRMVGIVHDITERKEAEKALLDSQAKYSAIVDGFDGYIYIYSEDYDIEFMNQLFIKRIGYDAVGQKCSQVLENMGDICPWCKQNMALGNETARLEIHNQADKRWYYIINTPINNPDKSKSRMVIIQDITEKKENEIRLIMSERLSALGHMASGIAHEINNPLATISACADGLLNRMKKGKSDPGVLEDYLKIINEEVMRCKNITTNMLSLVRETTYEKKDVDINEVLDKTLELIGFQGRLKKVEVITNYQGKPVILGSEGELKQVFLSIIMNALDAMDDKGTLTLETGMEDREAFINIKDTGHGISSEDMNRIFDPFFTTKIEKGGTGLGLSISNKIIAENYGKIHVVSEQGNGTTFSITLPTVQSGNMSPH
jgi:PAS domain S-box-containing protein